MAKTVQNSKFDVARAYADRIVLSGIARVTSTLRLGELAQEIADKGITLSDLRQLLATNPERFAYHDRRWLPRPRVEVAQGPLSELVSRTLKNYAAPMPMSELASEIALTKGISRGSVEPRVQAILQSDERFFLTPSGYAGLSEWMFIASDESDDEALFKNGLTEDDVAPYRTSVGRTSFDDFERAARTTLNHVPISPKIIGYYAWKQLNPTEPYEPMLYDPVELFDALLQTPGVVFGADGKFHSSSEVPGWLKLALKEAEKATPFVEVEEAAPLELGEGDIDEMANRVLASPVSLSVGKLLQEKYELTPADRTYPEDLANAVRALKDSGLVWHVGGDRFRKPDSAPEFIYTIPGFFHFYKSEFLDDDGEPIDVELSDDGFGSSLRKEMGHTLAQDVLDEDEQIKPKKMPESVRLVLKSLHREIGTFPLCQFPPGWLDFDPKVQELVFVDSTGKELYVWLNNETRLLYNLLDWWFEQQIESGAVFTLTRTQRPNVFDFRWEDEADPLLFISSERMEQLRDLAARAEDLSTYEILMEVLSHYNKGAEFVTILAETNVVRRVTRRTVASILTGYHCFYQRKGSPVWHFDPKKVEQGFDKTKRKYVRT
ncbi:MAG: hypothetical protein HND42_02550 [Armatimonadetes bacterium]|nr:hypothetical protein [Armatimonadota bacterium]NOG92107.1 hypothetical protein [Armatimonadota bacterium]